MSEFIRTVKITLDEYNDLSFHKKDKTERIEKINRALKDVHQMEIEDLLREYSKREEYRNKEAIRKLMREGKF